MATNSEEWAEWAIKPINDALAGWTILAVRQHPIYAAGLVFDLERGGEKKTVTIFQDGSNAPMTLDTNK